MINCDCCNKECKTLFKDYRYIEGLFQGRCLMCKDCVSLNDVEVYKIATK